MNGKRLATTLMLLCAVIVLGACRLDGGYWQRRKRASIGGGFRSLKAAASSTVTLRDPKPKWTEWHWDWGAYGIDAYKVYLEAESLPGLGLTDGRAKC